VFEETSVALGGLDVEHARLIQDEAEPVRGVGQEAELHLEDGEREGGREDGERVGGREGERGGKW